MGIYTPFTYIIGWSQHKKFYYGCKYAQGCQPSDLWESYFTSSDYVTNFRKENGEPDIIKIHRIFGDANSCVSFETKYLTKIDAKNNPLFLNQTNGNEKLGPLTEEAKEKRKNTFLKNYGVECSFKSEEIREKIQKTLLEEFGVENVSQIPKVKEKKKETWVKNYGFDHPFKCPEILSKCDKTKLEKYGTIDIFGLPIIKERINKTNQEKYGVDWTFQAEPIKETIKESNIKKFGVDNPAKRFKICIHCGEYKNIQHEQKCSKNFNRNIPDKSKEKNGRSKKFKMINTKTGESFIINGEFKSFCKNMKINYRRLMNDDSYHWVREELKKE